MAFSSLEDRLCRDETQAGGLKMHACTLVNYDEVPDRG